PRGPASSPVTTWVPGLTVMNSYEPSEPVTRFTETPVSGLSSVIVASPTTAPDESRTVPTTAAVSNCAQAGAAASIAARATTLPARIRRMKDLLLTPVLDSSDGAAARVFASRPDRSGTIPPTP